MKRFLVVVVLIYLVAYAAFRSMNAEVWEQDGNSYVIYPREPIAVYYLFRPLSYADAYLTGMRIHIGPHQ